MSDTPTIDEALKSYLDTYAAGKCPHCQAKIDEERQVGRCVYASPCGHRLFQGKAKEKPPKVHPYLLGKDTWE